MSELFMMVTITNRSNLSKFISYYRDHRVSVSLTTLGTGTANNEVLDYGKT